MTHPPLTAVDVHPNDYPTVEAVRWIGEELSRETNGRLSIRLYPSGQLGSETDTVTLTRFGVLDMCRVTAAALNNAFPLTQALTLPFSYRDETHMRHVVDGPIGTEIRASFAHRGLVALCFYDGGARSLYNVRRAINTPEDMRGLKIRVPRSDIFIDTLNAMGANATPISFGEVFTGLQTHLIDGAENNWSTFQSTRQYEVAPYWSDTRHAYSPDALLLSKPRFDAMPARDRELVLAKALESVAVMRSLWDAKQASAQETVLAAGVQRNDADIAAFQRAVEPMKRRYTANPELLALMRRIHDHA
jgi:tripartite ATP-independent transporter DctP family solute receptor